MTESKAETQWNLISVSQVVFHFISKFNTNSQTQTTGRKVFVIRRHPIDLLWLDGIVYLCVIIKLNWINWQMIRYRCRFCVTVQWNEERLVNESVVDFEHSSNDIFFIVKCVCCVCVYDTQRACLLWCSFFFIWLDCKINYICILILFIFNYSTQHSTTKLEMGHRIDSYTKRMRMRMRLTSFTVL